MPYKNKYVMGKLSDNELRRVKNGAGVCYNVIILFYFFSLPNVRLNISLG